MSATSVTMTATCLNGKPLEALERLIAQRQREMGETTSEAVIATAINALSSIRAATRVVDVKKASGFVAVTLTAFVPSFKTLGSGKAAKHVLCIRYAQKGAVVENIRLKSLAPRSAPIKDYKVFLVEDRCGADDKAKVSSYYLIALSEKQARQYATDRRAKRIERYAGMGKWTIGQAQSQVSQKGVAVENVSAIAQQIGVKELQVAVYEHGWGAGAVNVTVADTLRYAALALKGGPGDVDTALMRAANRTAGIINAHIKKFSFDTEALIPTPFPEVAGRKR